MDGQFEIVIYRLKPDVDRDQFIEISTRATEWLRTPPAIWVASLEEDDNGQWVDLVRWATIDDALAAQCLHGGSGSSGVHGRRRAGKHNHAAPAELVIYE